MSVKLFQDKTNIESVSVRALLRQGFGGRSTPNGRKLQPFQRPFDVNQRNLYIMRREHYNQIQ